MHDRIDDTEAGAKPTMPGWGWPLLVLVLVLGLGAAWQVAGLQDEDERRHGQLVFERQVDDSLLAVRARMAAQAQLLAAGAGLFAASREVDRREWRAFAESLRLDENYPGLLGFGYAQMLSAQELAAHEAQVRAEGFPAYAVRPAGEREEYSAIVFLEPFAGRNLKAFGFDMFSEATRHEAMARARDTGQAALSGKVTLVQEGPQAPQAGTLLYLPVYSATMPHQTVAERRAALNGFVYSPFRMDDLMQAAIGTLAPQLGIEIYDGKEPAAGALLFALRSASAATPPSFQATRAIEIGQRAWTLQFTSLAAFDAALPPPQAPMIRIGGALVSLVTTLALALLITQRQRALALAERMSAAYRRSESRARAVVEHTAEGIVTLDSEQRVISANPAALRLLGDGREPLVGQTLDACVALKLGAADGLTGAAPLRQDLDFRRADGQLLRLHVAATTMLQDGLPQHVVMLSDLTTQWQAERAAEEAGRLNAAILRNAPFCVIATDTEGLIRSVNPAAERLLWYRAEELIGQSAIDTLHDRDELRIRAERLATELGRDASDIQLGARPVRGLADEFECHYRRKDGSRVPVNLAISALLDGQGLVTGFLGIAYDITERKRNAEYVYHLAHHDALTGLPNRVLFEDRAEVALQRAHRNHKRVGLLLLDLDRFKQINDSLGHHVGDEVLKITAGRLKATVRESDTVVRMGGDEFCILLADLDDPTQATTVAEKIRLAMQPLVPVGQQALQVTTSIGVAIYPEHGKDLANLLQNADAAMYEAKALGRNAQALFDPRMHAEASRRLTLQSQLRLALERDEFLLHHQPVVRLQDGQVTGYEALLRWNDPRRGLVWPDEFIAMAEETGLIVPIGEWVIRQACADAVLLQQHSGRRVTMAVNISPRQFRQSKLVAEVHDALAGTRLNPADLELEITESVLMEDPAGAAATLEALRGLGVQLVIDDFGTGYSSLSYLHRFPVQALKIDRSFVEGLPADRHGESIVTAVLGLGRSLGLRVVAEGIETAEQQAMLMRLGCEHGQGFRFGKPQAVAVREGHRVLEPHG